jgi:hypothetical protein
MSRVLVLLLLLLTDSARQIEPALSRVADRVAAELSLQVVLFAAAVQRTG